MMQAGRKTKGESGRKADLIKRIMIKRNINGMTCKEAKESVQGYSRESIDNLLSILKSETDK